MSVSVKIIQNLEDLFFWRESIQSKVGFVPTMGALHEGHLSLIRHAKKECDKVIVSIFVNPLQFGPNEDFSKYPKPLDKDTELLKQLEVDVLFAPFANELYPKNMSTQVVETRLSQPLCGEFRPGHFTGVATVVLKLFNLVRPGFAYFGLKDYQQCKVIERMVRDLSVPVTLKFCPTLRETDGLAMSSRNVYLLPEERKKAATLNQALKNLSVLIQKNPGDIARHTQKIKDELESYGFTVQYLDVVDRDELLPITKFEPGKAVIATAAKLGNTRLIDNLEI